MRTAKRLAVAGVVAILAVGIAPAQASSNAGGKVSTSVVICCKG
jgi:hypothetical protein